MMHTTERQSKKTIVFGGSFDPFHKGHLHLLDQIEDYTPYERVIVVPARVSNFKQDRVSASAMDRYNIVKIALNEYMETANTRLELIISDLEIKRGGVSYTYDTVRELYDTYDIEGRLAILIGDDLLSGLDNWYKMDELKQLVDFICFTRDKNPLPNISGYSLTMIPSPAYSASSTQVRNGDLSQLTEGVRSYVINHKLYRS